MLSDTRGLLIGLTVFVTFLAAIVPSAARATVYLQDDATGGDCTSVGVWETSTKTCTLAANVYDAIEILSSGLTLDCAGHEIIATGAFGAVEAWSGIDGNTIRFTVSIGVTTRIFDTLEETIKQADQLLYQAKKTRNQVVCE